MPPIWVGFWAQNSLDKGLFFGRFSINMGGFSRNWRKIVENGLFSAKIRHKSGYDGKFRYLEEGNFLKTGRQTPVHPQVMYPPPRGRRLHKNEEKLCLCAHKLSLCNINIVYVIFVQTAFHSSR